MSYFFLDEYKNMEMYIPGEQPKDKQYIKLNANESSFPPSPKVLEAMSMSQINGMSHYSDPHCMELRTAIGAAVGFGPEQVFVGNGADEVLGFCMMSFFKPGMKVCFPDITYDFYRTYAKTYQLDYEQIPLKDDLTINVDDYVNTDRDVILANPNNPTGICLPVSEIERIVAKNPKRMVIVDEAYVDYGNDSCVQLVSKYPNLVVVQTFSKSRNMPGARIGFAISSKDIIEDMNKIKFTFNPFNMSSLAIAGGTAAVQDEAYFHNCVAKVIEARKWFEGELAALGFGVIPTTANFAFFRPVGISAEDLCRLLKEQGILVRHYADVRIHEYIRVTVGTREEMETVLKAIKDILEESHSRPRVLISDYKEQMEPDYTMTVRAIQEICPEAIVVAEPYGTDQFYRELGEADGLITAFLPVDRALLARAPRLKYISQNAIGYSNLHMEDIKEKGIAVSHIVEYCTREVAEHAITLMLSLNRNLPRYGRDIQENHCWNYQSAPATQTLQYKRLAIFGFGRIGTVTAKLAQALGMEVLIVDPYVTEARIEACGVKKVSKQEAFAQADIIVNHMALTKDNYHYFDRDAFHQMERQPIFINVGRGGCVDEAALLEALDRHLVFAAGLDVLEDENPNLEDCPFVGRSDVILTPHCAFYSSNSIQKLHQISGHSMGHFLCGELDQVEGFIE